MPVTYDFDEEVLALRMVGEYEPADIRGTLVLALRDPRVTNVAGLLFDVSDSTVLARRSLSEVRTMAAFLAHNGPAFGGRLALVAATDIAYGLMRVGGADVESAGVVVRAFRKLDEAKAWLLA